MKYILIILLFGCSTTHLQKDFLKQSLDSVTKIQSQKLSTNDVTTLKKENSFSTVKNNRTFSIKTTYFFDSSKIKSLKIDSSQKGKPVVYSQLLPFLTKLSVEESGTIRKTSQKSKNITDSNSSKKKDSLTNTSENSLQKNITAKNVTKQSEPTLQIFTWSIIPILIAVVSIFVILYWTKIKYFIKFP